LPKKVARPAVPLIVGAMACAGSLADFAITEYNNAPKDAYKEFPPKASTEEFENASRELHNFDQLIIDKAHSGATNIDTSQIPR